MERESWFALFRKTEKIAFIDAMVESCYDGSVFVFFFGGGGGGGSASFKKKSRNTIMVIAFLVSI